MTMIPIVLIGGGGHAKVVSALVGKIGKYRIVGYTALAAGALPPNFAPYLGEDHALPGLVASGRITGAVIGIGIIDVDAGRAELRKRLMALGLALPSIASPMAVINTDVVIGDGTVVMDGVVINPGAKIGDCSIINTNATVEHDCHDRRLQSHRAGRHPVRRGFGGRRNRLSGRAPAFFRVCASARTVSLAPAQPSRATWSNRVYTWAVPPQGFRNESGRRICHRGSRRKP